MLQCSLRCSLDSGFDRRNQSCSLAVVAQQWMPDHSTVCSLLYTHMTPRAAIEPELRKLKGKLDISDLLSIDTIFLSQRQVLCRSWSKFPPF